VKIRQGFVSNSSSASFIVTLFQSVEKVMANLKVWCWQYFDTKIVMREILESNKDYKTSDGSDTDYNKQMVKDLEEKLHTINPNRITLKVEVEN